MANTPIGSTYAVFLAPNTPPVLELTSMKDLSFAAIKGLNQSQLSSGSARLGSAGLFYPKEATYHFEFYRALHAILEGCLYPIPEYGNASRHAIDLMSPHYRWEIELPIEGRKITKHLARFKSGGAYRD
jgi:hypothetical protein